MKLMYQGFACLLALALVGCSSAPRHGGLATPSSQTYLQLGLEYLNQGDMPSARKNLEKARDEAPADYHTQLAMALYQQKAGDNDGARQSYQKALGLAPGNGSVMNNYGAFLCGLGQYVAAQQQFTAAAQAPDDGQVADSFENAGYCFLHAGQSADARKQFSRALKNDPDKGAPLIAQATQDFEQGKRQDARLMLDVYNHTLPASAESLWLQIRFAALDGRQTNIDRYGKQLARNFPQSKQYQQFLANEY